MFRKDLGGYRNSDSKLPCKNINLASFGNQTLGGYWNSFSSDVKSPLGPGSEKCILNWCWSTRTTSKVRLTVYEGGQCCSSRKMFLDGRDETRPPGRGKRELGEKLLLCPASLLKSDAAWIFFIQLFCHQRIGKDRVMIFQKGP